MEKTMTAESLYHELFLYHPEYDEKEWVGNYDDFLAHEKQRKLSLINQFKEVVVNDIIQILWDDGNGFPCSREVAKKENCLQCKEIYKKIDNYLKSNP